MNAPAFARKVENDPIGPTVPSLERKRLRAYIAIIASDVLMILAGFALAGLIYRGDYPDGQALLEAQLILPLFLTIAIQGFQS